MPKTSSNDLVVDEVSVTFGSLKALDAVSLQLRPTETLGLIGPNGSGKTTMVNVITGFQRPANGTIRVGPSEITHTPPEERVAAGLARTFQAVRLFGRLTVAENVEAGALGVGASSRGARATANALLKRFGLSDLANARSSSLPYGLERRVALARALATRPRFLLLDEPAAGLDEDETDDLASALLEVRTDCGLLVIEHDMRLITKVCDEVQVLAAGRTLAVGAPRDVVRNSAVVEAYLGSEAVDV